MREGIECNCSVTTPNTRLAGGETVKICVFGAGGVGGYFGARLAQSGTDVSVIARGRHLEAIRENGLRVHSGLGDVEVPVAATDDPSTIGPCDVVILTVKAYDTGPAARQLHPLLDNDTAVVSFQNGIDNEARLSAEIGSQHVMGGAAYIFSRIARPGVVEHAGGPARLVFGELDGRKTPRAVELLNACQEAGIDATLSSSIRTTLWTKFSFIVAASGITAASHLPVGDLRDVSASRDLFVQLVREVAALAAHEGIELGDDLAVRHLELLDSLAPGSRSSLYHDLSQGRRMELEALHGEVVARSHRIGAEACACETVYAILRPHAIRSGGDPAERPGDHLTT